MKPTQAGIRRGPAVSTFIQTRNGAVVNDLSLLIAPGRVDHLSNRNSSHIAGDDAIHKPRRVGAADPVLEKRRDVNQCRRVSYRVVLMLMMRFICADGVVAGPFAIVQTLA